MRRFWPVSSLLTALCCLIGVILLAACNSSTAAPISSGSTTVRATPTTISSGIVYSQSINITRSAYNSALAKWQAEGITEYEVTSHELSLRSTNDYPEIYRVKGDQVTVLRTIWTAPDTTPTPLTVRRSDLEADNTIQGLFDIADKALNDSAQRTSIDIQTVYYIEFDPNYDYITYFQTECHDHATTEGEKSANYCPSDTYLRIQLSNFKILSRGASLTTPAPTP